MSIQQIMRWGHDFLRIRGGGCLTLSHGGKPIKTITTHFLSFSPIIYFCKNLVEAVIAWEWEEYGKKFELGRAPIFEKCILTPSASKNPKTSAHSSMHSRFHFFLTHSLIHVSSLRHLEIFVCIRSCFWLFTSFFLVNGRSFL